MDAIADARSSTRASAHRARATVDRDAGARCSRTRRAREGKTRRRARSKAWRSRGLNNPSPVDGSEWMILDAGRGRTPRREGRRA